MEHRVVTGWEVHCLWRCYWQHAGVAGQIGQRCNRVELSILRNHPRQRKISISLTWKCMRLLILSTCRIVILLSFYFWRASKRKRIMDALHAHHFGRVLALGYLIVLLGACSVADFAAGSAHTATALPLGTTLWTYRGAASVFTTAWSPDGK